MNPRALFGMVVASVLACRSTPTPSPTPTPAPAPVVDVVVADAVGPRDVPTAQDAAPTTAAAPADAAADAHAPATPQEALVRALAAGTTPMTDAVDPARGLARISFVEGAPGGDGSTPPPRERVASRHVCGDAVAAMRSDLQQAIGQGDSLGIQCDAQGCVVSGMEYAPTWYIRFRAPSDGGTPRIASITEVSEASMGDAWTRRAEAYVRTHLATETARRCPAPAAH